MGPRRTPLSSHEPVAGIDRRALLGIPAAGALHAMLARAQTIRAARPDAAGSRFNADGTVRRFPGNTIISPVPGGSEYAKALANARGILGNGDFRARFALLPVSSYHMTVFDGVVDSVRDSTHWPADLPLDAPLATCTEHFDRKLRAFDLGCDPPFRLRAVSFQLGGTALAFQLAPVDSAEETKLRGLRDRLAKHLALKKPDHERYVFHISMAYLVNWMTSSQEKSFAARAKECLARVQQAGVLELDAPGFCTFEDMYAFSRRFQLKRAA